MKLKELFQRPEYRLATKITSAVLAALFAVIVVTASFGWVVDERRIEDFFEHRLDFMSSRKGDFSQTVMHAQRPDFESRLEERRFLPQGIRNFAIAYQDGTVSVVGSLEADAAYLTADLIRELPLNRTVTKIIGDEEYVLYAVNVTENRRLVLYEQEDFLVGPRVAIFSSLLLGVIGFSVALFFISLSFARMVIRPIEELAERERAYARHIAHELKTPLSVAKSDLELAIAIKDEAPERIESAISEIASMRDTVDDLLLFSASWSLANVVDTDLSEVFSKTIGKTWHSERFDVTVESDAPKTVEADPKLLATLFRNLASNALVHAPEDSKIVVNFRAEWFEIMNSAPDADPKILSRAFDEFVGTPGKGSWIGLSLVKRIAEAHGWVPSVRLDSWVVTVSVSYG